MVTRALTFTLLASAAAALLAWSTPLLDAEFSHALYQLRSPTASAVMESFHQIPLVVPWGVGLVLALATMVIALRLQLAAAVLAVAGLAMLTPLGLALVARFGVAVPALCPVLAVVLGGVGNLALAGASMEKRRIDETVRFQSRLQAIEHLGDPLTTGFDRRQLLAAIMRWVSTELQAERSSVMLIDRQERALRFEVALGPGADGLRDILIPLGTGISGLVAQTGEPVLSNNLDEDPRHAREFADAIGAAPKNLICVPMRLRGEVIGVVEALGKRNDALFDEQDLTLLSTIAQQAALLLENARLFAELEQRVDFANAELRQAYSELSAQKAKVDTLINQLPSPVIATDASNTVVLLNRAAEAILATTEAETLGRSVYAVVPVPDIVAFFAAEFDVRGHAVEEMTLQQHGGPRIFRSSLALVRGPDGQPLGKSLVMIDITELRELDAMKNDLISFVSHELRNPIGIISGCAQLARRRAASPDSEHDMSDCIARIDRQTRRMERLVEDFMNVSRLEGGRRLDYRLEAIHDLREMIRAIVEFEPRRTDAHDLVVSLPEDLPPVCADRGKVEEVFANIVNNAVKYSPKGGRIEVSAIVEGDMIHFAISDQGLGIPEDALPNLFGKFQRVRGGRGEAVPGTGLGLYLAQQLVAGHGGTIWAESVLGEGSTFHFTLPIARDGGPQPCGDGS